MDEPTQTGHNRTGMEVSPLHSEMLSLASRDAATFADTRTADHPEALLMSKTRRAYVNEADALGSMPSPGSMASALKSVAGMAMGRRMQVLVDKIAERLAFERGGTRLYDAALVKVLAFAGGTPVTVERMTEIRNQEAEHAELLRQSLLSLGADPTAQTPGADLVGVQAMGLIQAVTDPRTSLAQTMSSLLAAELIDVASWEMLSRLARSLHYDEICERFDFALEQENEHLQTISAWYEGLVNADAKMLT